MSPGIDAYRQVVEMVPANPDASAVAAVHRAAPWIRRTDSIRTLAFPAGWPDGVPVEAALG